MGDVTPLNKKRPVRWDSLRADEATRLINEAAQRDDGTIAFSSHAFEREGERSDLCALDAQKILRSGTVCDQPQIEGNSWVALIEKALVSQRDVVAVVKIKHQGQRLLVKTVYWKD